MSLVLKKKRHDYEKFVGDTRLRGRGNEMTRKLKALILILVATIALSGCANDDGIYSDKGQVFRKILSSDLTSLDTSLITDEISSEVTAQTFEGLYTLGKGDKPVLGVAKAFPEKSKDGKTLKVKLRSDAKWSNGDKVTAQDFVYAWRKTVDPKTGSEFAYIMGDIKNASDISTGKKPVEQLGIKALDDETLQIELEKPVPYINQLLALNTFAPQNEKVAKNMVKIMAQRLIERYTMVHLKLMIGNKKIKRYYLKISIIGIKRM